MYMSGFINVQDLATLQSFLFSLLTCLCIGLGQIWIFGGLEGITTRSMVDLMEFFDWFAVSRISLSPDSDLILLFCRLESEKAGYKHFLHKKIPDRVRKSGHRTFYNILHKQDKMAYTVPRFDPYIYLFAKQKNNEEGKRDISSWRGNVVQMWWRKKGEW